MLTSSRPELAVVAGSRVAGAGCCFRRLDHGLASAGRWTRVLAQGTTPPTFPLRLAQLARVERLSWRRTRADRRSSSALVRRWLAALGVAALPLGWRLLRAKAAPSAAYEGGDAARLKRWRRGMTCSGSYVW